MSMGNTLKHMQQHQGQQDAKEPLEDGDTFFNDFPTDILYEVCLHLSAQDIIKCMLVCKNWKDLLSSQTFWKAKCRRDHGYSPTLCAILHREQEDFKELYIRNPYYCNLLHNPDASKGLNEWNVITNGGNGWCVEQTPIGSDEVLGAAERLLMQEATDRCLIQNAVGSCWATSYSDCMKEQVIDLVKIGCSPNILDHIQPDILVSEFYAARFDCGIEYCLSVELLANEMDTKVISTNREWQFQDRKPAGRNWYHAKTCFSRYGPGVRYIRYRHGGKDTQFWRGHYGAKIALSSVVLCFKNT